MNTLIPKLVPFAWKAFYALFAIAFVPGIIFIFFRSRTGLSPILLPFITVVLVLPLLIGAWHMAGRIALTLSEKTQKQLLIAFLVLSGIVQLIIGNRLRFVPMWDVEAIFDGGRYWALTGHLEHHTVFHVTYLRYFAMKSVQWGSLFLFRCLFWVYNLFGGTDFYRPALVWNVAMVQVTAFAMYSAAKRLKGLRAGLFVLFLLVIFLPFHFFGAVFYTDTLSMPFVAIAFALYLRAKDEQELKRKMMFFAACGLAVAVGAAIKTTVLIVLVAILIDLLLTSEKKGWRTRLLGAGAAALAFVIFFGGFYMYMSRIVIGPELTERYRLPRTHWFMMGLQGYGHYCPRDFDFTMNIHDLATRQSETSRVARERIRNLGFGGMAHMYAGKFAINFGDGTYELHRILHLNPVNYSRMHYMVLSHGRHFNAYMHIATGITTALLLLMLKGALFAFFKPGNPENTAVPCLSFFGLVLLLTVWESGGRLTMNFFPMLVIGAIIGLSVIDGLSRYAFFANNAEQ